MQGCGGGDNGGGGGDRIVYPGRPPGTDESKERLPKTWRHSTHPPETVSCPVASKYRGFYYHPHFSYLLFIVGSMLGGGIWW